METNADGSFKSWPDELNGAMNEWFHDLDLIITGQAMGILTPEKAKAWENKIDKKKNEAVDKFYGNKKR